MKSISRIAVWLPLAAIFGPAGPAIAADPFTISSAPLFLAPPVKPNLMVILDNSQSMDALMSGKIISGNDPLTRGNIARDVLRSVVTTHRNSFNWGLTTFDIDNVGLRDTFAYYLGNETTMAYTADCVAGISAGNGGRRCLPNPAGGGNFITYDRSGDDSDINDVTYVNNSANVMYGVGLSGTTYNLFGNRDAGTGWAESNFSSLIFGNAQFSATDAGFVSSATAYPRRLWLKRGWGYRSDIDGDGRIIQTVQADSTGHYNSLMAYLAPETNNVNSGEIKNAASFTPLAGTLDTVKNYFRQGVSSSRPSPISETCQANFVVLATDGNPTGRTDGTKYAASDMVNTFNAGTGTWSFGLAQTHVFGQINALRSTTLSGSGDLSNPALAGQTFNIRTYVIGMGDSVANASSVAALNEMARLGGASPTAFLGNSLATLTTAFESIVSDIEEKTGTASSVAVNAGSWNAGSHVYQAKFSSKGWSGNLVAYPVSSAGAISSTPTWEAAPQILAQNWNTQRKIITYKPGTLGSRGVKFRWPDPMAPAATDVDATLVTELDKDASGSNDGHGALRLAFLRGDASREARNCATPPCSAPQFRNRTAGPLGDIVNSAPYYVAGPAFGYADDFESAPYSSFAATYRTRTPVLYVGANDGMLHAINANTGAELFAYVPYALYGNLSKLTASSYSHRYFVDGSPTVGDVFYGGAWHTLLVSGMRAGAKGLFALNVTNPASFSEANAPSIARWEFQDDDMGHVYGQPLLVKTNDGKWSVLVGGGYNSGNSSGNAFLFVIDAETGVLTRKIDTGAGSSSSPNGLSAPAAIDSNGDGVVDLVYAGDLNGNLWKFDLTSATPASWARGNGGAVLFAAGATQPITGAPDVTRFPQGGFLIGFGTGRYLATSDSSSSAGQSIYAVRDSLINGAVTLDQLQQQSILGTASRSGVEFRLSSHAVGVPADTLVATKDNLITKASYLAKKGWYLNLPTSGERVVGDATFRAGRLIFASLIPDATTACAGGGSGWLLEFDAITGNRLGTPTFDTNGDANLDSSDFLTFSIAGSGTDNVSGRRIQGITATPAFMSTGRLDFRLMPNADGPIIGGLGVGRDGRAMWREVR